MNIKADFDSGVFFKVLFYGNGAALIRAFISRVVMQSNVMNDAYAVFLKHGTDYIADGRHIFRKVGAPPCARSVKIAAVGGFIALRRMGMINKHLRRFR